MKPPKRWMIVFSVLSMGFGMLMLAPASEAMCLRCVDYDLVCDCEPRTTATFTRVGATCAKARQNAIDAAVAAAVCDSNESPCGSVGYFVSNCTVNHLGQTQASSFATYACETCSLVCAEYEDSCIE